ncbi:NADP-dependent 3-hydroxy acid dehydrogenase YdfG [Posidoniimonas polymericola]|uniref:NADP-dependent 3-hydroxy acid dehydrogenase YdfG n=1 Tax=Posidoniimonas polymericola TaxID=2528002 RepID=A0A5C5YSS9_9BACT|nr:SDR family oxidoreductase [Posidoniimonas polymericola]TWT78015.1 NADP-dependent 3-hydroxy acid dehydrogenase YdfG [Posidoniimonas polymericola]
METVLITGASSGIGRELARLFAADGARLVLTARREQKLHELANELKRDHGAESIVIPKDLADPAAPRELLDQLKAAEVEVDVLVNNAGFGAIGRFVWLPVERQTAMAQMNVVALTELTRLFTQGMANRKRGGVLNVGSTASFQPGPFMSVYYASKAYVRSFSEGIAYEFRRAGITVTCLCPGPTKTEFGEDSGMESTLLFRYAMPVEQVARAGYNGFRRGKLIVVPGVLNKVLRFVSWASPPALVRLVVGRLQRPK